MVFDAWLLLDRHHKAIIVGMSRTVIQVRKKGSNRESLAEAEVELSSRSGPETHGLKASGKRYAGHFFLAL